MKEVSKEARAEIIIALGEVINYQYASNITDRLVYELVKQLVPDHRYIKPYGAVLSKIKG